MKIRLVILATFLLLLSCAKNQESKISLVNDIPANSSAIIRIHDFHSFKSELKKNDFLQILNKAKTYDGLTKKLSALSYIETKEESVLAFTGDSLTNIEYLLFSRDSSLLFNLESVKNKKIESITARPFVYEKYTINDAQFYYFNKDNSITISSSEAGLISFLSSKPKSVSTTTLEKLFNIANTDKAASILMNLKTSNPLINSLFKKEQKENLQNLAHWILLDIDINQNEIQLNGLSIASDTTSNYLNIFKNTNPLTDKIAEILPNSTSKSIFYGFDDNQMFFANQKKYFNSKEETALIFQNIDGVADVLVNNKNVFILSTYESDAIIEYLNAVKKNTSTYQGREITSILNDDAVTIFIQQYAKNFNPSFFTLIDNQIIFAEEQETLQTIISKFNSKSTLNNSAYYTTLSNSLPMESSLKITSNSNGISTLLEDSLLSEISTKKLSEYSFGAQAAADQKFYHTNIVVKKTIDHTKNRTTSTLFNVSLDNDIATTPQFVLNHRNNKKEIIVQDVDNNLYLISTEGKILWKKPVKAKIQGRIEQVDIYKNGRLQFAFCTDNQFLVMDRTGEIVKPFEISFPGGNLNPLAVFNYEGKKDYRFVITQGEKVFMYNNKARIVTGFKYKKSANPILGKPNHFRVNKKDYIVFQLEDGSLKILNRVGNTKITIKEKIDFSTNQVYLHKNNFMLTDKKGTLYAISTKGQVTTKVLNLNKDHGIDATSKTLAVINDNMLSLKGKEITLDLGVYSKPTIFYIKDKIYVSVTDIQNQKIYLFDSQGKTIPNFPVFGNSIIDLADIDNDNRLELVAKDQENSLIIYKVN